MYIEAKDIRTAHDRIRPFIHHTPVLRSSMLDELTGAKLFFKCENLQKIGAFKIRGALNAVLALTPQALDKGVATHSSGNHAQALAYAARLKGVKAFIVMPDTSPAVKINAVKGYGGAITFCAPNQQARESTLQKILDETGAAFIHPYNDYQVITGQATAGKELVEEINDLDCIIAPVGGGGLLSGTCLSARYFSRDAKVYAAEPAGAADAELSLKNGRIEDAPYVKTIADGLMTKLGTKTFPLIKDGVEAVLTAEDDEIITAMRLVFERMKIVIEPSSAVALAVILKNKEIFQNQKIGIIISGGNVDPAKLGDWLR
jgi:threonine dehydratase